MNQDQKFMDFIIMERMRIGYDGWKHKSYMNEKEKDSIYEAYAAVVDTLPDENKKAIEDFCDMLTDNTSVESEFFYHYGVKDGYKLCKYIENMLNDDVE